jgi:hypothetical protein
MNHENISWYPLISGCYFSEFFTDGCDGYDKNVILVQTRSDKRDGPNFNSVIVYQQRYFIVGLERVTGNFWLELRPIDVNATCSWSPLKPTLPVNK